MLFLILFGTLSYYVHWHKKCRILYILPIGTFSFKRCNDFTVSTPYPVIPFKYINFDSTNGVRCTNCKISTPFRSNGTDRENVKYFTIFVPMCSTILVTTISVQKTVVHDVFLGKKCNGVRCTK